MKQMRELMSVAGFNITVLERAYSMLKEWDEQSYNVLMVGKKSYGDEKYKIPHYQSTSISNGGGKFTLIAGSFINSLQTTLNLHTKK